MTIMKIVTPWQDEGEILHRPARRVRTFDESLHRLLDSMVETMRDAHGVGLAAPQVGIDKRITVVEYPEDEENPEETLRLYELINPEVVKARGAEVGQEGCLSLPGLAADVDRATQVVVRAQDRLGNPIRIKAYGWFARVLQHEIDHLHGVLMTERAEQVYRLIENDEGEIELVPIEGAISDG